MVKRKKKLSESRQKLLALAIGAIVVGGFYRVVVEPFSLKAKVARPIGNVNPSVATSSLASQSELPFLKTQGTETLEGGEVYDGVFFVETKPQEPETPQAAPVEPIRPDYSTLAQQHYHVQMISNGGAIVNNTYYSFGETIKDKPFEMAQNNVVVKLMSKVNNNTVRLMVDNKYVNVAIL